MQDITSYEEREKMYIEFPTETSQTFTYGSGHSFSRGGDHPHLFFEHMTIKNTPTVGWNIRYMF